MATAVTDTYLQQIQTARTSINDCFKRGHELLTLREDNMLKQLEDIQIKYEKDTKSNEDELQDLEKSKQNLKSLLRDNDILNKALEPVNYKIEQILKLTSETQIISFEWNTDIEREIQHAGEIIVYTYADSLPNISSDNGGEPSDSSLSTVVTPLIPDYKNKSKPVISCCKHNYSNASGDLYNPKGLAIEPQKGRIYIADCRNDRVQVFTSNGEYCSMFNNKMNSPWGICIHDNIVYVSQYSGNSVNLYKLAGTLISTVGSKGKFPGQFINPTGIAINGDTGYLYICDYLNHRVHIYDNNLKLHLMFGYNLFQYPNDVQLTSESVIVLDKSDPCIHIFNSSDHSLLNNIVSRGESKQVANSYFFAIDNEGNILLTDSDSGSPSVKVFSKTGAFIAQFGRKGHAAGEFTNPTGVAIDDQSRVVVVSCNSNHGLQIF